MIDLDYNLNLDFVNLIASYGLNLEYTKWPLEFHQKETVDRTYLTVGLAVLLVIILVVNATNLYNFIFLLLENVGVEPD